VLIVFCVSLAVVLDRRTLNVCFGTVARRGEVKRFRGWNSLPWPTAAWCFNLTGGAAVCRVDVVTLKMYWDNKGC